MHLPIIIEWMAIWFSMAAPIGPIGILCIRRSLAKGRVSGFITGLGTASADALFAGIALFGTGVLSGFFAHYKWIFEFLWALFILYLGFKFVLEKPANKSIEPIGKANPITDFLSTFVLTLTNPMTILSLTAIFTGIDVLWRTKSLGACILLVVGVFMGSALWWFILSHLIGIIKRKSNQKLLERINTSSWIVLLLFASGLLIKLLLS